ncbi:uncharacterized protein B0H18DRAFT_1135163 [Fomitopsis serialis]|uniref:uncharacterized protein n=1 Tax=Fomitopsis serialis TaxID=139415 RepID=UPI002007B873|nr:uncharacterized protein B0H18DRAFT_1135163 [Neoantrodia serialis]KAH9932534.1 hypothetical protein B0H18DRAFT_1135163 [Neoantrodia serialis]
MSHRDPPTSSGQASRLLLSRRRSRSESPRRLTATSNTIEGLVSEPPAAKHMQRPAVIGGVRPPAQLSKATADMLQSLRSDVDRLQRQLTEKDLKLKSLEDRLGVLGVSVEENHEAVCEVLKREDVGVFHRLESLENSHDRLWHGLNAVRQSLENMGPTEGAPTAGDVPEPSEIAPKVRKNNTVLQAVTRNAVYDMIGIDSKSALPEPTGGDFWVDDDDGKRMLRPTWDHWYDNKSGWVRGVAQKIQLDGHQWHGKMSAEELEKTPLTEIESSIMTVWESLRDRYKSSLKAPQERADQQRVKRHEQRKKTKLAERKMMRPQVKEMNIPKWDWFLSAWKYMSTDETGGEEPRDGTDAVDENTSEDEKAHVTVIARQKVWITHWPSYRPRELEAPLKKLEKAIATHRKEHSSAGGAQHAARTRGPPKDKDLPNLTRLKNAQKIPRSLVDPEWLEEHPDQNKPLLMVFDDLDKEYDGGDEDEEDEDKEGALVAPSTSDALVDPELNDGDDVFSNVE